MAIDMWSSESSTLGISPRISFSHDLCQADGVPIHRSDALLLDSGSDFDFCVSESFEQESSCADELFSDGKLLPLQIKSQTSVTSPSPKPPTPPNKSAENLKKESLKEIMEKSSKTEEKSVSRSFWRFTRSSSCGNGYKRSLICSLPLLSRSNSTGSAPNPKRKPSSSSSSTIAKSSSLSSSSSSSSSSYSYSYLHKPPLKKNHGSYNNGIRISPVLNFPPPYIPKGTVNMFGLGSFFCNGKDKSKKK